MSISANFKSLFSGRRILVTGHTGFKGSWLSLWLAELGAEVYGISKPPNTKPSLYEEISTHSFAGSEFIDISNFEALNKAIQTIDPHLVFHLAAQPLVRYSYKHALETFETNVLGTVNVLESCSKTSSTVALVCVTTDKVYKNENNLAVPFKENDPLGGVDPYSASKACAEIVAKCYQDSMSGLGNGVAIATARGGNVIGGGDWSEDRLVPDFVRAIQNSHTLNIRNPDAIRPWQHVLELTRGYLTLATHLLNSPETHSTSFNFGPSQDDTITVRDLLEMLCKDWRHPEITYDRVEGLHEAQQLRLDTSKANNDLGWSPLLGLQQSVQMTSSWYRDYYAGQASARDLVLDQIAKYHKMIDANEASE